MLRYHYGYEFEKPTVDILAFLSKNLVDALNGPWNQQAVKSTSGGRVKATSWYQESNQNGINESKKQNFASRDVDFFLCGLWPKRR